jgi:hypothetical protein
MQKKIHFHYVQHVHTVFMSTGSMYILSGIIRVFGVYVCTIVSDATADVFDVVYVNM